MRAMWPCAVPIQPACDSRRQLAFVNFHPSMSTSNAQRPTSNVEMVIADLGSASASLAGDGASSSQTPPITSKPSRNYHESFGDGAETSERGARAPRKLATIAIDFVLTRPRRRRFVDCADHCSGDDHLNDAADARKVRSSRSAQPFVYIHDVLSRGFVNGPDDCACDCELDHSAGDPAAKDFKC